MGELCPYAAELATVNFTDSGYTPRHGIVDNLSSSEGWSRPRSPPAPGTTGRDHMWEETMTKLIATAFAVALVSSVQAMPLAPPAPDDTLTLVREACGAGMHRVNGVCVRTHARRAASRCARGVTC
jgi:hypothetical protein